MLPQPSPGERPGPSIAQLRAIFQAHRRMAAIVAAGVLALGLAVTALLPRSYSAVASLIVDYDLSNPLNGSELAIDQVSSFIATQIELIRRPELLAKVADALDPADQAAYSRGYKPSAGPANLWIATQLGKKLEVLPGQSGSHVIYIEFTASNARRAAAIANAVVDAYEDEEAHREQGMPQVVAAANGARLKELTARVTQARSQLEAFEKSHGLHAETGNASVEQAMLADLQNRLLDARTRRIAIESRQQASASSAEEQGAVARMGDDVRAELATKEHKVAELLRQYGDQYPGLQQARQDVEDLRTRLAELNATANRNASISVSQARHLEQSLQAQVDAQRGRLNTIGHGQEEASRYWLELESAEKAYREALTSSYQSESTVDRLGHSNVHAASRASVPLSARSPKTWLLLLLAFAASIVSGLAVPFALEFRSRKLRHPDDFERTLGLPVLASFDRIESPRPRLP